LGLTESQATLVKGGVILSTARGLMLYMRSRRLIPAKMRLEVETNETKPADSLLAEPGIKPVLESIKFSPHIRQIIRKAISTASKA